MAFGSGGVRRILLLFIVKYMSKQSKSNKKLGEVVDYDLLENGLNFIFSGLSSLGRSKRDRADYKFGILHLTAGIELVMKERLRREHWSLLFENINCANKVALAAGNMKSVEFDSLVARLNGIAEIKIKSHEKKAIQELRKQRNKIQHLHISESREAIESIAAQGVGFVLDFIEKELPVITLNEKEINVLESIKELLKDFRAFLEKRLDYVMPELKKHTDSDGVVVECIRCLQKTLILGDGSPRCLFCNSTFDPSSCAEGWANIFLGRSSYEYGRFRGAAPTRKCPNCQEDTLVEIRDSEKWSCFNCGESFMHKDLGDCSLCGELFISEGEETVCDNCFLSRVNDPNS